MISKEDFKKALGDKVNSIPEEEIEEMRIGMDKIADILFDIWNNKVTKIYGKRDTTTENL